MAFFESSDQLANEEVLAQQARLDRTTPFTAPEQDNIGWFEAVGLNFAHQSALVAGPSQFLAEVTLANRDFEQHGLGDPKDKIDPYDPDFQVETVRKHPYLRQDFEDGKFLHPSFQSRRKFERYAWFARKNFDAQQRLARQNWFSALSSGLAGIGSADLALALVGGKGAGAAFKGLNAIKATTKVAQFTRFGARVAAGSALAGAENFAHESLRQALIPTTTFQGEQQKWEALKMGAYFGGALTFGHGAFRSAVGALPASQGLKMRNNIMKSFGDLPADGSKGMLENMKVYLDELLDEGRIPDKDDTLQVFDHPSLASRVQKVRDKWKDAGHEIPEMNHPQSRDYNRLLAREALLDAIDQPTTTADLPLSQRLLNMFLPEGKRQGAADLATDILDVGFDGYEASRATIADPLGKPAPLTIESMTNIFDAEMHNLLDDFTLELMEYFKGGGKPIEVTVRGNKMTIDKSLSSASHVLYEAITEADDLAAGRISSLSFDPPPLIKTMQKRWGQSMETYADLLDLSGDLAGKRTLADLNTKLLDDIAEADIKAIESRAELLAGAIDPEGRIPLEAATDEALTARIKELKTQIKNRQREPAHLRKTQAEFEDDIAELADLQKRGKEALDPNSSRTIKRELQRALDSGETKTGRKLDVKERNKIQSTINKMETAQKRQRKIREEIEPIQQRVENTKTYMPQRWLREEVRMNRTMFEDKLTKQFWANLTRNGKGEAIDQSQQEILHDAFDLMDDVKLPDGGSTKKLAKRFGEQWEVEDDFARMVFDEDLGLSAESFDIFKREYDKAVDKWFRKNANKAAESIMQLENADGVADAKAGGSAALKHRVLQIRHGEFSQFLDVDVHKMVNSYNESVKYKAAEKIAINASREKLAPRVKDLLGEDLDGTYAQLERAQAREAQRVRELVGKAGLEPEAAAKLMAKLDNMMKKDQDFLKAKGDELLKRGNLHTQEGVIESIWAPVQRMFTDLPYIAWMGKMVPASLSDMATLRVMNSEFGRKHRTLVKLLASGSDLDKRDVQMLNSVGREMANSRFGRLWESSTLPDDVNTAGRPGYAVAMAANRATHYLAKKLPSITGMNAMNRHTKFAAGVSLIHKHADAMRSMVLIQEAMDNLKARKLARGEGPNLTQKEVDNIFRQNKLSKEHAAMWSRQGFGAKQAKEFVELFYEHGLDFDGKPLKDRMSFDEFLKFKEYVHPNVQAWNHLNRPMANQYAAAVNTLVNGIIVDPNIMSRPIVNQKFWGRAFNQFWSFQYALSTQTMPLMRGQGPSRMAMWMTQSAGLGLLTEATQNWLSGRKSWEDSANDLMDNPFGAMWRGVDRAGLLGWTGRPLSVMDKLGIGMGSLLGHETGSGQGHRALSIYGHLAPGLDLLDRLARGGGGAISDIAQGRKPSAQRMHTIRTAMPYQNMVWTDLGYRITSDLSIDNPFGKGTGMDLFQTKPLVEYDRGTR